jgi:sterol desaturase/sphingolipid hydroxylase (fatty acid hydroxylase superfamily)
MALLRYTQECLDAAQGKWPASGGYHGDGEAASGERRRERPKTIRVFENGFIEKVFARAHPATPILWFGPLVAYGVVTGMGSHGVVGTALRFAAGWLAWTLLEYVLHRFLFHMEAHTPDEKFRAFMMHVYHHEFPNDKLRLVAPPIMSWPLALVVGGLYHFAFPDSAWVLFAGTATGYVAYDWIHYYTHHFRPGNRVGKWLKSYHLLHHFDEHHGQGRYGVSSPLWDFVFGTYVPLRKPAARTQAAAPR